MRPLNHIREWRSTQNMRVFTWLTHTLEVYLETAFVIDERSITFLVYLHPVANIFTKFEVLGRRSMILVRERPKETVSIAQRWCSVETESAQLIIELLCVLCGIAHKLHAK